MVAAVAPAGRHMTVNRLQRKTGGTSCVEAKRIFRVLRAVSFMAFAAAF